MEIEKYRLRLSERIGEDILLCMKKSFWFTIRDNLLSSPWHPKLLCNSASFDGISFPLFH